MPHGPGLTPGGPSGPQPRPSAELLLPPDFLKARLGGLSPAQPLQGRRQPSAAYRLGPGPTRHRGSSDTTVRPLLSPSVHTRNPGAHG